MYFKSLFASSFITLTATAIPNYAAFEQLKDVPLLGDDCILRSTLLPMADSEPWLYNPSLIKDGDSYLITVRHDFTNGLSKTGFIRYSWDFQQLSPLRYFNSLGRVNPQDIRIFECQQQPYIIYTFLKFKDAVDGTPIDDTTVAGKDISDYPFAQFDSMKQCLARVDTEGNIYENFELKYGDGFQKNWCPFVHRSKKGITTIYFIQQFNPYRILALNTKSHNLRAVHSSNHTNAAHKNAALSAWESRWGTISGGTPALLIGKEYLTFFHSYFVVDDKRFYVFGALTFENKPPFKITKISRYPIVHTSFYTAATFGPTRVSPKIHYVLFPGGFVVERTDGRDVVHLVCGENEEAVRLITIDKKTLLNYMQTIER